MVLLTRKPPGFSALEGGLGVTSPTFSAMQNLLYGFPSTGLLSGWHMLSGQPVTAGLTAHDPGRPARQSPASRTWQRKPMGWERRAETGGKGRARETGCLSLSGFPPSALVCTSPYYLLLYKENWASCPSPKSPKGNSTCPAASNAPLTSKAALRFSARSPRWHQNPLGSFHSDVPGRDGAG